MNFKGTGAEDALLQPLPNSFRVLSAGAAAFATPRGLTEKTCSVPGRLCFHSRFLQEALVSKPVNEAILPCPEWDAVMVGKPDLLVSAADDNEILIFFAR